MFLFDLDAVKRRPESVLAAACRVKDAIFTSDTLRFRAEGIAETHAVVRVSSFAPPAAVLVDGRPLEKTQYDYDDATVRVRFENSVEGHSIELRFQSN